MLNILLPGQPLLKLYTSLYSEGFKKESFIRGRKPELPVIIGRNRCDTQSRENLQTGSFRLVLTPDINRCGYLHK